MKIKFWRGFIITFIAIIFTIGLTFASVELPNLADEFLRKNVDFPDVATGQDELTEYKTELFLSEYHLRLIGYLCLILVLVLIVVGFFLERRGFISAGAVVLFLPVFGHFAATMFFLGGLAFLRLLWLPFFDVSFDVMHFGDIVILPYRFILDIASWFGINVWKELPFVITGTGLFIFLLGVLSWLYSRLQNKPVADFWIYRISRHPQYLGWIIWSYGILFLPGPNMKQYIYVASTLPWLLATMIIIGVAMMEERKMKQLHGTIYESYRDRTSFLLPLPRFIRKVFSMPFRFIFKRERFDRKIEIATIISSYTLLCIVLSLFYGNFIELPGKDTASEQDINRLVKTIRTANNRIDIRNSANKLAEIKGSAIDSLIVLLKDKNVIVRWYCAGALGACKSDKAVPVLISLLNDPDRNVRRTAATSLGEIGSKKAVTPLISAYQNPEKNIQSYASRALGKLGDDKAVQPLIQGLKSNNPNTVRWSAFALGEMKATEALEPLINCFEKQKNCDYYQVGSALIKLGSARAADSFIKGLKDEKWWVQTACAKALGELKLEKPLIDALENGSVKVRRAAVLALMELKSEKAAEALKKALKDEDFEVRMYARQALKVIKK